MIEELDLNPKGSKHLPTQDLKFSIYKSTWSDSASSQAYGFTAKTFYLIVNLHLHHLLLIDGTVFDFAPSLCWGQLRHRKQLSLARSKRGDWASGAERKTFWGKQRKIWPNSQTVEHIRKTQGDTADVCRLEICRLKLATVQDSWPGSFQVIFAYICRSAQHPAHGKKEHPFGLKVFWERLGWCCKLHDASPIKFGKWTADQRNIAEPNQTKHMYNVQIRWRIASVSFVLEHVGHELGKPETAENTSYMFLFRRFVLCRPQTGRSSSGFSTYQGSLGKSSCTSTNLFFVSQPLIVKDHVSCRLRSTQQRNFLDWLYWISECMVTLFVKTVTECMNLGGPCMLWLDVSEMLVHPCADGR